MIEVFAQEIRSVVKEQEYTDITDPPRRSAIEDIQKECRSPTTTDNSKDGGGGIVQLISGRELNPQCEIGVD